MVLLIAFFFSVEISFQRNKKLWIVVVLTKFTICGLYLGILYNVGFSVLSLSIKYTRVNWCIAATMNRRDLKQFRLERQMSISRNTFWHGLIHCIQRQISIFYHKNLGWNPFIQCSTFLSSIHWLSIVCSLHRSPIFKKLT